VALDGTPAAPQIVSCRPMDEDTRWHPGRRSARVKERDATPSGRTAYEMVQQV
jgi:hypothetical protein